MKYFFVIYHENYYSFYKLEYNIMLKIFFKSQLFKTIYFTWLQFKKINSKLYIYIFLFISFKIYFTIHIYICVMYQKNYLFKLCMFHPHIYTHIYTKFLNMKFIIKSNLLLLIFKNII